MVIGIAGGSCSGKSTLARNLVNLLGGSRTVHISQDNYYKDQSVYSEQEREKINYDSPAVIDIDLLVQHLSQLIEGRPIKKPIYDFVTHTRVTGYDLVYPEKDIILEGILIFTDKKLRDLMHLRIFLDITADIRLARRVSRDTEERGRTPELVKKQWFDSVEAMYHKYVVPTKRYADYIFTGYPEHDEIASLAERIRTGERL
jgi:uridine kinase